MVDITQQTALLNDSKRLENYALEKYNKEYID